MLQLGRAFPLLRMLRAEKMMVLPDIPHVPGLKASAGPNDRVDHHEEDNLPSKPKTKWRRSFQLEDKNAAREQENASSGAVQNANAADHIVRAPLSPGMMMATGSAHSVSETSLDSLGHKNNSIRRKVY